MEKGINGEESGNESHKRRRIIQKVSERDWGAKKKKKGYLWLRKSGN